MVWEESHEGMLIHLLHGSPACSCDVLCPAGAETMTQLARSTWPDARKTWQLRDLAPSRQQICLSLTLLTCMLLRGRSISRPFGQGNVLRAAVATHSGVLVPAV